jgi:hypothetical protein
VRRECVLCSGHRAIWPSPPHVAGAVGGQEPRSIDKLSLVQPTGPQRQVERGRDILDRHGGAQLLADDIAGELVEHGRQVEPAPADHLEIGEVGLPELVGRSGLVVLSLNASAALITMKAGLAIRSWAFSRR